MELISRLSRVESFRISKELSLQLLGDQIDQLCKNNTITKDNFRQLVVSRNEYFPDRLFQLFDLSGNGQLTKQQMIDCVKELINKPVDEKLTFFFQINDIDGDGLISFKELRHLLESCMKENGLEFTDDEINNLTQVLFEYADTDNTGTISLEEFQALINRHQGLMENISISIDRWLLPIPRERKPKSCQNYFSRKFNYTFIRNNLVSVSYFVVYCLINLTLFVWRVTEYAEEGKPECIWIARGAGICLNFNGSLILLLILRRTITTLRTLGLSDYFPIDQHIYYHKLCGYVIAFFSIVHTIAHLINFAHLATIRNISMTKFLFDLNPTFKWFYGAASITGWICLLSLLIIIISSLPCVRKSGHFEIFYYCHLFYFVFWIALVLHGPVFWIWFAIPCLIFIVERCILVKRMFGATGHTYIAEGKILPSKVAHLVIKRPPNFDFRPGDWVFIQIPSIAKWEWHPFTISSAPEMEDVLWLHIRGVGGWTKRVLQFIEQQERQGVPLGEDARDACCINTRNPVFMIENVESPKRNNNSLVNPGAFAVETPYNVSNTRTSSPYDKSLIRTIESSTFTMPLICNEGGVIAYCSAVKPNLIGEFKHFPIDHSPGSLSILNTSDNRSKHSNTADSNNNINTSDASSTFQTINLSQSRCQSLKKATNNACNRMTINARCLMARLSCSYPAQGISRKLSKNLKFPTPKGKKWTEGVADDQNSAEEGRCRRRVATSDIELIEQCQRPKGNDRFCSNNIECPTENMLKARIPLPVRLDGPYGSPSSAIFNTQHAVLISTGIGVTPFASILQSIMFRYLEARQTCPQCCYSWTDAVPPSVMKLKKVDFVWINREQKSFEWFVHLLSQLEITQAELMEADRFLDMHIYITSAIDNADIRAIGLHLALDLMHNKAERDLITGLKTRTRPGRPKWDEFFTEIQRKNKGRVSLFYCGPPPLGKILHNYSNKFGFSFHKEIF